MASKIILRFWLKILIDIVLGNFACGQTDAYCQCDAFFHHAAPVKGNIKAGTTYMNLFTLFWRIPVRCGTHDIDDTSSLQF